MINTLYILAAISKINTTTMCSTKLLNINANIQLTSLITEHIKSEPSGDPNLGLWTPLLTTDLFQQI